MKLWVDDLRPPPRNWLWATTSQGAISLLEAFSWQEISFDHDLGGDDTTRPIVLWLCEHPKFWPPVIHIHTANPVGREWLVGMIERYGPGVSSD